MKIWRRKSLIRTGIFLAWMAFLPACGSNEGGTGISNPPEAPTTSVAIASAVSALLNSGGTSDSIAASVLKKQLALNAEEETNNTSCNFNFANSPEDVVTSTDITPGTYGTVEESVTLDSDDACSNGGSYLSSTINEHDLSCSSDASSFTLTLSSTSNVYTRSSGVNQIDLYGTFTVLDSDTNSYGLDCHFVFALDPTTNFTTGSQGQCDDENGNTIEQTTDYNCVDAE